MPASQATKSSKLFLSVIQDLIVFYLPALYLGLPATSLTFFNAISTTLLCLNTRLRGRFVRCCMGCDGRIDRLAEISGSLPLGKRRCERQPLNSRWTRARGRKWCDSVVSSRRKDTHAGRCQRPEAACCLLFSFSIEIRILSLIWSRLLASNVCLCLFGHILKARTTRRQNINGEFMLT